MVTYTSGARQWLLSEQLHDKLLLGNASINIGSSYEIGVLCNRVTVLTLVSVLRSFMHEVVLDRVRVVKRQPS
jgi:hypothetical protein